MWAVKTQRVSMLFVMLTSFGRKHFKVRPEHVWPGEGATSGSVFNVVGLNFISISVLSKKLK